MRCPVIVNWNCIEVRVHDRLQHVRQLLTPAVVIAPALIGAGPVICRGIGLDAGFRTTLCRDQAAGIVLGFDAHLPDDGSLITDQPLVIDPVVDRVAVGDDPILQPGACGCAVGPRTAMGGG